MIDPITQYLASAIWNFSEKLKIPLPKWCVYVVFEAMMGKKGKQR